ncbi:hypothetical protein [Mycobacterium sp. ACS4331]|uniref:hypothetical protein n=1 Tax=Mycobacterium sp. ACS4331 TaxID=1834121 RepID=UPI0008018C0A|nr:hypothetical protein [Mycobacterium sp. ACS4331]OBF25129.1 hypothetical protein A5727_05875 [Mycobacterium sp. ACS4331]
MGKQRFGIAAAMAAVWVAAVYRGWVRPWIYTWGATPDEVVGALPGDEMVDSPVPRTTRAVWIPASPHSVWPWLAQIGEDRGGFYSYSWLERAVGADIHNAEHIHLEWQRLHVGDTIWLARRYGEAACQLVAEVVPGSHLVLVSRPDFTRLMQGHKARGTWSFTLVPAKGGVRLLARGCGGLAGHFWFDIPHFVMERRMLLGIRSRAVGEHHRGRSVGFQPPSSSSASAK